MLSRNEITRLGLAEKRQIVSALLRSKFSVARSFPLSFAQEQLWFMSKLQPESPVYNIPLYIPFQGSFDLASLKRALKTLTQRHDMLRVRFDTVDDAPVQIVEPDIDVDLPVEDLSGDLAGRPETLGHLLNEEVQKPFDLSGGLCVRYKLFRLDSTNHLLSVTMHHIVTDAWSLGVFVSGLRKAYEAFRSGHQEAPLAPLQVEYSDYARWQRATLRGLRLSKLVDFWKEQLSGAPHILQLPTDRPRPSDQTFSGTAVGFVYSDELSEALIALSRKHKVTLFMLMLACFYTLLYRYTGQEDILVGTPVANRPHPELEPVIGIFVNTLILRAGLKDSQSFEDLVKSVQKMSLDAFEHQVLPFPKLVDELNVERVPGYPPLYQVVFNFQNASLIESTNPLSDAETMHKDDFPLVHSNTSKVDLNLTVTQNEMSISGGFEYNTDIFDPETIEAMISHFRMIAEEVVKNPSIALIDIPLAHDLPDADVEKQSSEEAGSDEVIDGGKFSFEL